MVRFSAGHPRRLASGDTAHRQESRFCLFASCEPGIFPGTVYQQGRVEVDAADLCKRQDRIPFGEK